MPTKEELEKLILVDNLPYTVIAKQNERTNLRLVCPNCDSQLDTFKSKNKDSARAKYRKT